MKSFTPNSRSSLVPCGSRAQVQPGVSRMLRNAGFDQPQNASRPVEIQIGQHRAQLQASYEKDGIQLNSESHHRLDWPRDGLHLPS